MDRANVLGTAVVSFVMAKPLMAMFVSFISGIIVAVLIGYFVIKIAIKIEYLILGLSMVFFVVCVFYSICGEPDMLLVEFLSFFSTIVFSWLLTKKSSKEEFKSEQAELAKRSYRHINFIESTANTACKLLENLGDDAPNDVIAPIRVSLNSIQTGIHTCKLDWFDMLSDEDKRNYGENEIPNLQPDVNKLNMNAGIQTDNNPVINQEDA